MFGKLVIIFILNFIFLFNRSLAENEYESSVPPIQYPDKKNDEMQVRKEIKNSFYKYDEINPNNNFENKVNKNSNIITSVNSNDSDSEKNSNNNQKTFEELISKSAYKNRNDSKNKNTLNLKEQETPINKNSEMWKIFLMSSFFVAIIGFIGYVLSKFRKKGMFSLTKTEKVMNIVSTLPISPKRQILIIKIRDQEIVVSNTESGISFLTELSNSSFNRSVQEKKQTQLSEKLLITSQEKNNYEKNEQKNNNINLLNDKNPEKKSDILLKALKSINANNLSQKKNKQTEESSPIQNKVDSFPKYLANQFENESKKEVKKKDDDVDSVENVTNLIREKLRSMKPLN